MHCKEADLYIKQKIQAEDSPPFIGLVQLDGDIRRNVVLELRRYLDVQPKRIRLMFWEFPFLSAWAITNVLSEEYGENGQAVYRHIEDILGISLDYQPHRNILFRSFCSVCGRLGLPTHGFDRHVDVYLLHAGVSQAQLPYLVEAFFRQEAAFGPPPVESTVLLNRWEDHALSFLPPTVNVLRRSIVWDETAWHASLFARIRSDPETFVPAIEFEAQFKDFIVKRALDGRVSQAPICGGGIAPRPRLAWGAGELVLRLPRAEGRIRLWLDGAQRALRLRGGEDWTLPQPWPREIRWEIAGQESAFELLTHSGFLVFDRSTGYLLHELRPECSEIEVDTTDAAILSRLPFSIDNEPALEPEGESFVGFARIDRQPARLQRGQVQTLLRARPRRRLSLVGGEVANGPRGALFSPSTRLRVETGLERSESRVLSVSLGSNSRLVDVEIDENGYGELGVADVLAGFPEHAAADPSRLRVELMAPALDGGASHSSGIALSAWVWPSFRCVAGLALDSEQPPRNLVEEACLHIGRDGRGRLCLDPNGGYTIARAVFEIEGAHVAFDLPWPDVSVTRRRAGGTVSTLPYGSRLSLNEDDRFDTLSIRCPDSRARLIVRGRREDRPFAGGLMRTLAVRDLLLPAADNRVILQHENSTEILLFELVSSLSPQRTAFFPSGDAIRLRLQFAERVDAIALDVEDEGGAATMLEAALRYRPVATRRPDWFHAEVADDDALAVEITITLQHFDATVRLARLLIRPEASDEWRPLRNVRGDTFAVALLNRGKTSPFPWEDLHLRFQVVCRWLSDCYANECWLELEKILVPRWRALGEALHGVPRGPGTIMRAAALPPPEHTAVGWVAIVHPIQFLPDLYSASANEFAALAASTNPGVAEMAALAALDTSRLREQLHLHPTVYLAFKNVHVAQAKDVPLQGFNPSHFFRNLPLVDSDAAAGWFWRGTPLLGPDHWRAAHLRFGERCEAAGLFLGDLAEDGPNSRRQASLQRLMHAAWATTPDELRPSAPRRSAEADEPPPVDLWASALLSGFARASRLGAVSHYVPSLAQRSACSEAEVLTTLGFLLRLAPELFAFHLLLWQIAKERP